MALSLAILTMCGLGSLGNEVAQIRWLWLASGTDNLAEKRRCLEAILALEPNTDEEFRATKAELLGLCLMTLKR